MLFKSIALSPMVDPAADTRSSNNNMADAEDGRAGTVDAFDRRHVSERHRASTLDAEVPFLSGFAAVSRVSVRHRGADPVVVLGVRRLRCRGVYWSGNGSWAHGPRDGG